jgi:hypothetical protein
MLEHADVLSPTWRLWVVEWSALEQLASQLQVWSELTVRFGSMQEVGGLVVDGPTLAAHLCRWVREDCDSVLIHDSGREWEVALDIYDAERPRIGCVVSGELVVDVEVLGGGVRRWRWDFLSDAQNAAVWKIRNFVVGDGPSSLAMVSDSVTSMGLQLLSADRDDMGCVVGLTIGVAGPRGHQMFDDLKRALAAEVPSLVVSKAE